MVRHCGRRVAIKVDWSSAEVRRWSNDQNLWMALGLVTWTGAPSRG
jgi:hypothetical protein